MKHSSHTYQRVQMCDMTAHMLICVTCLLHMSDMSHWCVQWHESIRMHMCDRTHSCVWHHSFMCVTSSYVWHDCFISVTWLIDVCDNTSSCVCDMTQSYVWRDPFMYVTWLIRIFGMAHANVLICVTWLVRMRDMTHSCVWQYSSMCVT